MEKEAEIQDGARFHIRPPIPAPYLADAPQLSPHLSYGSSLSIDDRELDKNPRLRLEMQKQVLDLKQTIRRKRKDWEEAHGVVIVPEKPTEPD